MDAGEGIRRREMGIGVKMSGMPMYRAFGAKKIFRRGIGSTQK